MIKFVYVDNGSQTLVEIETKIETSLKCTLVNTSPQTPSCGIINTITSNGRKSFEICFYETIDLGTDTQKVTCNASYEEMKKACDNAILASSV